MAYTQRLLFVAAVFLSSIHMTVLPVGLSVSSAQSLLSTQNAIVLGLTASAVVVFQVLHSNFKEIAKEIKNTNRQINALNNDEILCIMNDGSTVFSPNIPVQEYISKDTTVCAINNDVSLSGDKKKEKIKEHIITDITQQKVTLQQSYTYRIASLLLPKQYLPA